MDSDLIKFIVYWIFACLALTVLSTFVVMGIFVITCFIVDTILSIL